MFRGKEPSYDHLKVFGCRCFVHVPKDERSKLDDKARQCIFLGYGEEKWGYKLYEPISRKVLRSRDVVFMEDQTVEDFLKGKELEEYVDDLTDLVEPDMPSSSQGEE